LDEFWDPPVPFIDATSSGDLKEIQKLLSEGADVNQKDMGCHGETALSMAASKGDLIIVELLLKHGADVNAEIYISGRTALMAAATQGHENIVELLIKHGAGVEIQNDEGFTALDEVLRTPALQNNESMLTILRKHGAVMDPSKALQAYVSAGLSTSAKNILEMTPEEHMHPLNLSNVLPALVEAIHTGNYDIVKMLLDYGVPVDATLEDGYFATPLIMAAGLPLGLTDGNHAIIIKLLLDRGADIDLPNKCGETPLMVAITFNSSVEVIDLLVKRGADLNKRDRKGNTALHHMFRSQ